MPEQNDDKPIVNDAHVETRELSEDERIERALIVARVALAYRRKYSKRR